MDISRFFTHRETEGHIQSQKVGGMKKWEYLVQQTSGFFMR
jgi:hypothetical protein